MTAGSRPRPLTTIGASRVPLSATVTSSTYTPGIRYSVSPADIPVSALRNVLNAWSTDSPSASSLPAGAR